MYYLYILRNGQNDLYIAQTNNLERRLSEHSHKLGAKYIKDNSGFYLVYFEKYLDRKSAMNREIQLKHWTRAKKSTHC